MIMLRKPPCSRTCEDAAACSLAYTQYHRIRSSWASINERGEKNSEGPVVQFPLSVLNHSAPVKKNSSAVYVNFGTRMAPATVPLSWFSSSQKQEVEDEGSEGGYERRQVERLE